MNREQRRTAKKAQHAHVASLPDKLTPIPRDQMPGAGGRNPPFQAWWSRKYLVQVYAEDGDIIRLSVCRSKTNGKSWEDGITWDELQAIKNEVGYADRDALEVYPRAGDVVNVANIRHLWVMPRPVDFAWRAAT